MLKFSPAVFAVGKNYQIIVTTKTKAFISIKIGDKIFVDDSNGILCSAIKTHNIEVPQKLLDEYKHYTVIERKIIKRLPYFSLTEDDVLYEFDFRPVPDNPKCYHIADAHNDSSRTVAAAKAYGDIDFLILNGDIPEDSSRVANFNTIFKICSDVTNGNIPIVFARGNHDLRGTCAELFAQYAPRENGNTYYSFRLGKIWGLCLDCGEDKNDNHKEYGHTVACHQFREKETEYIKRLIFNSDSEYNAEDVEIKLVIVHMPFTHKDVPPFDIEEDIYRRWAKLLNDYVKPNIMICGHTHEIGIYPKGCDYDTYGQPCTMVVGAGIKKLNYFIGSAFEFEKDKCKVVFTSDKGETVKAEIIDY
jgi:acid phosphatase type 7